MRRERKKEKKEEGGGQEEGEKRRRGYDSFWIVAVRIFVKKNEVCAQVCLAHVTLSTCMMHHTHALDPKTTRKEGNRREKRGAKLRMTKKGY